ncbi:MAG: DEAD/DEAH box helicase [Treponema sp.]|jgi:superfamily II DNA/RNA helicase|nr:DEAD/DEAH box helicase [Treponema sp.]
MQGFEDINVNSYFINKLNERYIKNPTGIQQLVIPKLMEGKSILFRSATGTGKTFAYLLPVLQLIEEKKQGPAILIAAPTLELCSQIKNEVEFLLPDIKPMLLIGSASIDKQIETLKRQKPLIVIGNPGRLFALAKMGKLKLNLLSFLILDEADRLTVQECLEDTTGLLSIIKRETGRRNPEAPRLQVIGCSATVGKKTYEQLGVLFKDAELAESEDHEILRDQIKHWAIFSEKRKKTQTLRSLLAAINNQTGKSKKSKIKILVFTGKNDDAALIYSRLVHHKIAAAALIGKVNKKPVTAEDRKAALDSFRNGSVQVLVATDLAARGLDIRGVTHVVALDVPADGEFYIHRAGRTGRAGKSGIMITIGDETQMRLLASLEKKLKIKITPKELYGGRISEIDFQEEH